MSFKTKQVTILLLPESSMMTLSSVLDPLRAANRLASAPLFKWRLLSPNGKAVQLTSGIEIAVSGRLTGDEAGEILFIVAGFNHGRHIRIQQLPNLRKAAGQFSTVCAIEAGTWVLARAGVIEQQTVTTHWEDLENLAFAYPLLNVVNERFTIDKHVWSSGGAAPTLDMVLHYLRITEKSSLAIDVANVFIYAEGLGKSEPQAAANVSWLKRAEPRLVQMIELMTAHIEEPLSISVIAVKLTLSIRTLELICKKHLKLTPAAYYLRLRLQVARRLVLDTNCTMLDVAVRTGFTNASSFTRAFKARYETSPSSLRRRAYKLPTIKNNT